MDEVNYVSSVERVGEELNIGIALKPAVRKFQHGAYASVLGKSEADGLLIRASYDEVKLNGLNTTAIPFETERNKQNTSVDWIDSDSRSDQS